MVINDSLDIEFSIFCIFGIQVMVEVQLVLNEENCSVVNYVYCNKLFKFWYYVYNLSVIFVELNFGVFISVYKIYCFGIYCLCYVLQYVFV